MTTALTDISSPYSQHSDEGPPCIQDMVGPPDHVRVTRENCLKYVWLGNADQYHRFTTGALRALLFVATSLDELPENRSELLQKISCLFRS